MSVSTLFINWNFSQTDSLCWEKFFCALRPPNYAMYTPSTVCPPKLMGAQIQKKKNFFLGNMTPLSHFLHLKVVNSAPKWGIWHLR